MYHFTVPSVRPSLSPISRLRRPPLTIERMSTSRLARRLPRPYSPSSSVSMTRPCRISDASRSEEHTSELQSLMRISYAVFCLKKKKKKNKHKITIHKQQKHDMK